MARTRDSFAAFAASNFRLLWGGTLFSTTAFMTTFLLYLVVGVVALMTNVPLAGKVTGSRAWPLLIGFGFLMALVFVMGALTPFFALTPTFFALMLVAILVGISTTGVMLVNQALIMTNTRPEYFGRVMSFVVLGIRRADAARSDLGPERRRDRRS